MKYYLKGWQNYVNFKGRASRSEYWYFALFHFIVVIILAYVSDSTGNMLPYMIYFLASILPSLAVAVRRMHDVGKSGWYCLIPIYNLILAVTDSQPGDNQYGPNPHTGSPAFDFEAGK